MAGSTCTPRAGDVEGTHVDFYFFQVPKVLGSTFDSLEAARRGDFCLQSPKMAFVTIINKLTSTGRHKTKKLALKSLYECSSMFYVSINAKKHFICYAIISPFILHLLPSPHIMMAVIIREAPWFPPPLLYH